MSGLNKKGISDALIQMFWLVAGAVLIWIFFSNFVFVNKAFGETRDSIIENSDNDHDGKIFINDPCPCGANNVPREEGVSAYCLSQPDINTQFKCEEEFGFTWKDVDVDGTIKKACTYTVKQCSEYLKAQAEEGKI